MQLTRRPDDNYDMTFGQGLGNFAVDSEAVRVNIAARLRVMLGEFFLDTSIGVPYIQSPSLSIQKNITDKPTDLSFTQAVLKKIILDTEDVVELTAFDIVFDPKTRGVSINGSYTDIYSPSVQNLQVNQ
jgi:hypothetical protein